MINLSLCIEEINTCKEGSYGARGTAYHKEYSPSCWDLIFAHTMSYQQGADAVKSSIQEANNDENYQQMIGCRCKANKKKGNPICKGGCLIYIKLINITAFGKITKQVTTAKLRDSKISVEGDDLFSWNIQLVCIFHLKCTISIKLCSLACDYRLS